MTWDGFYQAAGITDGPEVEWNWRRNLECGTAAWFRLFAFRHIVASSTDSFFHMWEHSRGKHAKTREGSGGDGVEPERLANRAVHPRQKERGMPGLRGKDQKRSSLRDERSGTYDRATSARDANDPNVVPADDIPEGLQRKPKGAPNKGFRRGERAGHVPQNE